MAGALIQRADPHRFGKDRVIRDLGHPVVKRGLRGEWHPCSTELPFRHIVVIDFEFEFGGHASSAEAGRSGERPRPVCMVAKELRGGETWRLWRGEFTPVPPFPVDDDTLLVAYYASAELGCFKALGWRQPKFVLDLFTEFRRYTNGVGKGSKLINAATHFGLDAMAALAKQDMVSTILRGGSWTAEEQAEILKYCESDVLTLESACSTAMVPKIDLPRALLRGRYMKAAAAIEWSGVPIDTAMLALLRRRWTEIQDELIAEIDSAYGVYDGRSFKQELWRQWLIANDVPWPTTDRAGRATQNSTTTPSGKWPRPTRRCRRFASSAARYRKCV